MYASVSEASLPEPTIDSDGRLIPVQTAQSLATDYPGEEFRLRLTQVRTLPDPYVVDLENATAVWVAVVGMSPQVVDHPFAVKAAQLAAAKAIGPIRGRRTNQGGAAAPYRPHTTTRELVTGLNNGAGGDGVSAGISFEQYQRMIQQATAAANQTTQAAQPLRHDREWVKLYQFVAEG